MMVTDLEGLVAQDHQVRIVWAFAEAQDLSPLYDKIAARDPASGRPAIGSSMSIWKIRQGSG